MGKYFWSIGALGICLLAGLGAYFLFPDQLGSIVSRAGISLPAKDQEPAASATETPLPSAVQDLKPQPPEDLKNAEALLERGTGFLEGGFLSLAINDFFKATELDPQNRQAHTMLIKAQIAMRDYGAAEASGKKALAAFTDDPEFLILLGETQVQKSEFEAAKNTFGRLPDSPSKNFYLGVMNVYFEDMETAKTLLNKARADKEFGERANILLAAFEEFSLFPGGSPLHLKLLLCKALDDLNFYEMAIQKAKSILKEREDYRDAWLILGHSYLSLGRNDLAKSVLDKALELDPTKSETAFFLGQAEAALGDYENAITHLSMARENGFEPKNEITKALAEAYLAAKYFEAARVEYEKLIETNLSLADAYVEPVRISIEHLNDLDKAKALAEKAVTNAPESPVAQNLLGWAMLEKGETDAAKDILTKIVADKPDFSPAYYNLGKLFETEGELKTSLDHYRKAYDLAPHTEIGSKAAERYNTIVLQGEE